MEKKDEYTGISALQRSLFRTPLELQVIEIVTAKRIHMIMTRGARMRASATIPIRFGRRKGALVLMPNRMATIPMTTMTRNS